VKAVSWGFPVGGLPTVVVSRESEFSLHISSLQDSFTRFSASALRSLLRDRARTAGPTVEIKPSV
jgi:hypothetical protein